jgi:hypothetical protein
MGMLTLWTVYDHPRDCPEVFVARKFMIEPWGPVAADSVIFGSTLEAVRWMIFEVDPNAGVCVAREPGDDPSIVETWL